MKNIVMNALGVLVLMLATIAPAWAQSQSQVFPINQQVGASGSGTATVTIAGVASRRTVIYQVLAACGTSGLPGIVPTVVITDMTTGVVPFSHSHSNISNVELPHVPDKFVPGLTFPPGNTVQVQANVGAACFGGTSLSVQADQF